MTASTGVKGFSEGLREPDSVRAVRARVLPQRSAELEGVLTCGLSIGERESLPEEPEMLR